MVGAIETAVALQPFRQKGASAGILALMDVQSGQGVAGVQSIDIVVAITTGLEIERLFE
jgi:hypothetical protein